MPFDVISNFHVTILAEAVKPRRYNCGMQIKVLSEKVANQIAAGEVIERPASVVKELIENSIDAGASEITILLENAGRSHIRIEDDGAGIAAEDLALAIASHATSKLSTPEDLLDIKTLGFRGEAFSFHWLRSQADDYFQDGK